MRDLIEQLVALVQEADEKPTEKPKYMKWHLGLAHDKMYGPAQDWIHHPHEETKKAFIDSWRGLSDKEKAAHADDIKATFQREHGGEHATVYRYRGDARGGSSVSTKKPEYLGKGNYKTYRIHHSDVIAHYGQEGLPFGNKTFGHEKEIILHPDAKPQEIKDED